MTTEKDVAATVEEADSESTTRSNAMSQNQDEITALMTVQQKMVDELQQLRELVTSLVKANPSLGVKDTREVREGDFSVGEVPSSPLTRSDGKVDYWRDPVHKDPTFKMKAATAWVDWLKENPEESLNVETSAVIMNASNVVLIREIIKKYPEEGVDYREYKEGVTAYYISLKGLARTKKALLDLKPTLKEEKLYTLEWLGWKVNRGKGLVELALKELGEEHFGIAADTGYISYFPVFSAA